MDQASSRSIYHDTPPPITSEGLDGFSHLENLIAKNLGAFNTASRQYDQIEYIRKVFEADSKKGNLQDTDYEEIASVAARIIKIWQEKALGADPTTLALSFGPSVFVTLRQVLFLLPQKYQYKVVLENGYIGPQGLSKSWIDESIMNVLIDLSADNTAPGVHFARGLASDSSYNLDRLARVDGYTSRLEYLCREVEQGRDGWNASGVYTVPNTFCRLVAFWNYWENHWVTIYIDSHRDRWMYQIVNPLPTTQQINKDSIEAMSLQLGTLIRSASSIAKPSEEVVIYESKPQQQLNGYECGIFAVINAFGLLSYKEPPTIDPHQQRLEFLVQIWTALESGNGVAMDSSPGEKYYHTILRQILEDGTMYHKILVIVFDRLLKGSGPTTDGDSTIKAKMIICINTGLRQNVSDEEIAQSLEKIPYSGHNTDSIR